MNNLHSANADFRRWRYPSFGKLGFLGSGEIVPGNDVPSSANWTGGGKFMTENLGSEEHSREFCSPKNPVKRIDFGH